MDGGFLPLFLIRAAHRLAVDCDHSGRSAGQRRHPGDETVLEFLGVERGEDIAELIMRRRAIRKRSEPAQKVELPRPEAGDFHEAFRSRQNRQQTQQQHLIKRVDHLAPLPGRDRKWSRKTTVSPRAPAASIMPPRYQIGGGRWIQNLTPLSRTLSPDCPAADRQRSGAPRRCSVKSRDVARSDTRTERR